MKPALAEAIAAELDDGWRVCGDGHDQADRFELHAPTGERIRVVSKGPRLAAYGLHAPVGRWYPSQFCLKPRTIAFAANKPAHQIAAELRRRLIPNVREVHREMATRQAARNRRLQARRVLLERAAAQISGLDWKRERDYLGEPEYTEAWHHYRDGRLDIQFEESCEEQRAKVTIVGVRPHALLKVLDALREIYGGRAGPPEGGTG
jgi:hypothetical protein